MRTKAFSRAERNQLSKLEKLRDKDIDTVDIPEAPAENWIYARRGEFYRPRKQAVTIRLDADLLAWFRDRAQGRGYQTEINRVLRQHVTATEKRRT